MTYRLPPAYLDNPSDKDFAVGETLLEAISASRVFDIEPSGAGFKLTERCDDYFSLFLTAPQLYQLGTELRELAKTQLTGKSDSLEFLDRFFYDGEKLRPTNDRFPH